MPDLTLKDYEARKCDILLGLGFPRDHLWLTECTTTADAIAFYGTNHEISDLIRQEGNKPYIVYYHESGTVYGAKTFSTWQEFLTACQTLALIFAQEQVIASWCNPEPRKECAPMHHLNPPATDIFRRLIHGLNEPGDGMEVNNAENTFMAVHIDFIYENRHGQQYALAHHYLQNRDVMCDPEMTFLVAAADQQVYPLTYRQDALGINQIAAEIPDDGIVSILPELQADLTTFANQWMMNIAQQQGLLEEDDGPQSPACHPAD